MTEELRQEILKDIKKDIKHCQKHVDFCIETLEKYLKETKQIDKNPKKDIK